MGITQFCRILSRKSLFAKSKLTNLKNTGVGGEGGGVGGRRFRKVCISKTPYVWRFSSIAHTQERRQGVPCMSSTRLSRSGLPSLI